MKQKTTAVLFDLDGTLLPMDQNAFVKIYFTALAARLAPYGYEAKPLADAVWAGTAAMVKNDGSQTNEEVYWQCFTSLVGEEILRHKELIDDFYRGEFRQAMAACAPTPEAAATIRLCRELGYRVILATNPIFPAVATENRIRWAGLSPEDFELYTTYENSRCCKPNLDYYRSILSRQGLQAEECCMVGNDVSEDMAARELGLEVFLLTDCLINRENRDITSYPRGSFPQLQEWLRAR